jgi:hypothetical protein
VGGLEWFLPEGATLGGFTTYVLVQNPNPVPVTVTLTFQTERGEVPGPTDALDPGSRKTYAVNAYVPDTYDVSTRVTSAGGFIVCERAMYWRPSPGARYTRATDPTGFRPCGGLSPVKRAWGGGPPPRLPICARPGQPE